MYDTTTSQTTLTERSPFPRPNFEAMVTELLEASRWTRKYVMPEMWGPFISPDTMAASHHLEFYAVGLRGSRQSGKTTYLLQQLSDTSIIVTVNLTFRDALREQLQSTLADSRDADLAERILSFQDCHNIVRAWRASGRRELPAFLTTLKMVLVDELGYMEKMVANQSGKALNGISAMSRLGGQVPELILMN